MKLDDKYIEACEKLDWTVHEGDGGTVDLEKYSPAGEDFCFFVSIEHFAEEIREYAAYFDIDAHIEMWIEARHNGMSGVPSTRELVKDAEDIDTMLKELAEAVTKVEDGSKEKAPEEENKTYEEDFAERFTNATLYCRQPDGEDHPIQCRAAIYGEKKCPYGYDFVRMITDLQVRQCESCRACWKEATEK